jgi:hypothetical protein
MVRYIVSEVEMDFGILFASVFLACVLALLYMRLLRKKEGVESQLVVTATFLLFFYTIGIISGLCTIFNFLFRWVF